MNHTEIHKENRQLAAAGVPQEVADALSEIRSSRLRAEDAVRSYGHTLQRRIQFTFERLEAGQHINSSGELQSAALSFDLACAERQIAISHENALAFAIVRAFGSECTMTDGSASHEKAAPGEDMCRSCKAQLEQALAEVEVAEQAVTQWAGGSNG